MSQAELDHGRRVAVGDVPVEEGAERAVRFLGLRTPDEIRGYAQAIVEVAAEMRRIADSKEKR